MTGFCQSPVQGHVLKTEIALVLKSIAGELYRGDGINQGLVVHIVPRNDGGYHVPV